MEREENIATCLMCGRGAIIAIREEVVLIPIIPSKIGR